MQSIFRFKMQTKNYSQLFREFDTFFLKIV